MISAVYRDKTTGKYLLDERALFARPYWLCSRPDAPVFSAAAIGAIAAVPMELTQEAPFIGEKFLAFRDTECLIRIKDEGTGRYITPEYVHIDCITGTAQQPFLLQDPLWMDPISSLHVEYIKLAAGLIADEVKFYVEGTRYYEEDANIPEFTQALQRIKSKRLNNFPCIKTVVEEDAIVVGLQAHGVALLANATGQYHVQIPNNYHFTIKKVTAVQATGAVPGAFTIRYYDHRGNQLGNGALDSRAVIGTGLQPELLRQPFTIERDRLLRLEITDLSGAPNNFFIAFIGAAHYVPRIGEGVRDR